MQISLQWKQDQIQQFVEGWYCYKVIGEMDSDNILIHIPLETLKTQYGLGGSYKRLKKRQCICQSHLSFL